MLEITPVNFCLFFIPLSLSFAPSSQFTRVKRYSLSKHSRKSSRNVAENKTVQIRRFKSQKFATVLFGGRLDYVKICTSYHEVAHSRYVVCDTTKASSLQDSHKGYSMQNFSLQLRVAFWDVLPTLSKFALLNI